jgi:hypothetical protein
MAAQELYMDISIRPPVAHPFDVPLLLSELAITHHVSSAASPQ